MEIREALGLRRPRMERKCKIDEWNNSPANLPWTAVDELEMVPEFM